MANEILLEAGTNELELLVFRLGPTPFGINVAKVREIVQRTETIAIPHAPAAVEGSFKLREKVLTLVNLGRYFEMQSEETASGAGQIIIVQFNKVTCGILVDAVEMIHRLRWDDIAPPSPFLANLKTPITGSAKINGKIVLIADFETIIGEILGVRITEIAEQSDEIKRGRDELRILLADDSAILRDSVARILRRAGFEKITICSDGQEAWDYLDTHPDEQGGPCDLVISDIEMPRMDGLHLTSRIKKDPALQSTPVVLFSSLITDDNRKKGEMVGADAQISKPDGDLMVQAIEECLRKTGRTCAV